MWAAPQLRWAFQWLLCDVFSPLSARQSPASPCHYWFLSCECRVVRALVLNTSPLSGATGGLPIPGLSFLRVSYFSRG